MRPTYKFPCAVLLEQLDSEKLTDQRPCLACAAVTWVQGNLFIEL